MVRWYGLVFATIFALSSQVGFTAEELPKGWPKLPNENGVVEIPAQEWPIRLAPRHVKVYIYYPFGRIEHVTAKTGLMLTLHNWGGTEAIGSPEPKSLTERLDVVSIAVDYLQSGKYEGLEAPEPYDFGYLQALDSLRGLWYVQQALKVRNTTYDASRIYATGGSAGGHVAMMCNKFAPRTFTCIVDICGMTGLSDDIAFGRSGGSSLNGRWEKVSGHRYSLTTDDREIRLIANPLHLAEMTRLGNTAKIIVVHGVEDMTAPYSETKQMVESLKAAKFNVEPLFINKSLLDGKVFTGAGHALGPRTDILFRVAEKYLRAGSSTLFERKTSTDCFRREVIQYATTNGHYTISYESGFPVGRFEKKIP